MSRLLFVPAELLMSRLNYVAKFSLISILFLLPIGFLSSFVVKELNSSLAETRAIREGLQALNQFYDVYLSISEYRDLNTAQKISGSKKMDDIMELQVSKVRDALQKQSTFNLTSERYKTWSEDVSALAQAWEGLVKENFTSRVLNEQLQNDSKGVNQALSLLRSLARNSGLARNENAAISLTADILVHEYADLANALANLRMVGVMVGADGYTSFTNKALLEDGIQTLKRSQRTFRESATSLSDSGLATGRLNQAIDDSLGNVEAFVSYVENITKSQGTRLSVAQFQKESDVFIKGALAMRTPAVEQIEGILDEQADTQSTKRLAIIASLIALILLILYLYAGFYRSIKRTISSFVSAVSEVAKGNMTAKLESTSKDEMGTLCVEYNTMVDKMHHLIASTSMHSGKVATQAEGLHRIVESSQKEILEQQQEINRVTQAMNEMGQIVDSVSRQIHSATQSADDASRDTTAGRDQVDCTLEQITHLASNIQNSVELTGRMRADSDNISQVLDVIKGIAEQTNLLALNAAIEAARAGDQGRGFAVVADEVRTLAARTQDSTEEIAAMISSLQEGVQQAVDAMESSQGLASKTVEQSEGVGAMLERIAASVANIAELNRSIAEASTQQSSVARKIEEEMGAINQRSETTATNGNETKQSAQQLAQVAETLNQLIQSFRL
ncbi:methyl-accepting chemotaxis protein [Sedimenticola sp.]|uniref:methyl-accepting chemotaxis protein n=1 Tax=Sedimenticola sp. TaxID=1940285 RepID=UPI003D1425DA